MKWVCADRVYSFRKAHIMATMAADPKGRRLRRAFTDEARAGAERRRKRVECARRGKPSHGCQAGHSGRAVSRVGA